MNNSLKTKLVLLSLFAFTGCGIVGDKVISDKTLQQKAAFALSTSPQNIQISNRTSDIDSIRFTATTNGKAHQCYITTVMGAVSSDALCNNMSKAEQAGACNALLRSAGKCK